MSDPLIVTNDGPTCYEVNDYKSLVFMENAGGVQYDTARELNDPLLSRTPIAGRFIYPKSGDNSMSNTKGILFATAAAALFVSNALLAQDVHPAAEGKVKCGGVNACKGKAECNTSADLTGCKGKNACAGKGWVSLTKEECETKGGKVAE